MSKIHREFSLQLFRNNNKGQLPLLKQVDFGYSYLIQILDKHSRLLFLHKRINYVSFSVEAQGFYSVLRVFQGCIFMVTDEKKQILKEL